MTQTITQSLLSRSYGNVTDEEVIAAGGVVYEESAHYTKYELADGSKIAVPYVPFSAIRKSANLLTL